MGLNATLSSPLLLEQFKGQRFCLLLRGIAFREGYKTRGSTRMTVTVDYRKSLQNAREKLIQPLQAIGELEIILCSYSSSRNQELLNDFKPVAHRFFRLVHLSGKLLQIYKGLNYFGLKIPGTPILQGELLVEGLRLVAARAHLYDCVIISRFDLEYLLPANLWPAAPGKINIPWRESEAGWKDHQRVGDCIHVIPISLFPSFLEAIESTRRKSNLHFIFPQLVKHCGKDSTHFLCDGYLDSNTDRFPNPFYRIVRN